MKYEKMIKVIIETENSKTILNYWANETVAEFWERVSKAIEQVKTYYY